LLDRGPCGQRDHRQVREPEPDRVQHLETILAGKRQVQQHKLVVAGERGGLPALSVLTDGDRVPL
jgi:hypothetical protein